MHLSEAAPRPPSTHHHGGVTETPNDFGCAYCSEPGNRLYGHVTQLGTHPEFALLLLQCPQCRSLYEMGGAGTDTVRLTRDQAAERYPDVDLDDR